MHCVVKVHDRQQELERVGADGFAETAASYQLVAVFVSLFDSSPLSQCIDNQARNQSRCSFWRVVLLENQERHRAIRHVEERAERL